MTNLLFQRARTTSLAAATALAAANALAAATVLALLLTSCTAALGANRERTQVPPPPGGWSPTTPTATPAPTPTPAPPEGQLVWGKDASPSDPSWTLPSVGGTWVDSSYNTTIRRLTSAEGTRFNRNTYSRRQPENATGTMFFTYHGEAEYRVYNRATTQLVRILDMHPDAEPQWHPTNPAIVRFVAGPNASSGELRLYEQNVDTGQVTVAADLTSLITPAVPSAVYLADRAEGSPSADGNRYAWLVYDDDEDVVAVASYDLSTNTVLGLLTNFRADPNGIDWVGMSPNGSFVLMGYADGTFAYNANLTGARRITATGEHSDIAINLAGNDSYVWIDFSATSDGGWLMAEDLVTQERTRIFDVYDDANTSIHVSGKGYAKPGWVVVSTYNCKETSAWSCEKVMAVELQPNGRILMLAHTHNCGESYWTETHAAVNRDFTRVYFNTDSGSCGIDAEVMEIAVPAFS